MAPRLGAGDNVDVTFDLLPALVAGLPAAAALVAVQWWLHRRRGVSLGRRATLALLRGLALAAIVVLLARPVQVEDAARSQRHEVAVLVDRSESMSLLEDGRTRYQAAVDFARESLVPALEHEGWTVRGLLFADAPEPSIPGEWPARRPDGRRTDLAAAIAHALRSAAVAPLAVVALTDGVATESGSNRQALASLLDSGTPFFGVGFGHDRSRASLSLEQAAAPVSVAPQQRFQVTAQLQATEAEGLPSFDLLLLRDARMVQRKTVAGRSGSRFWTESFAVEEAQEGVHEYTVEVVPPSRQDLLCVNTQASARVRVAKEQEFRVLFVQGTLTWDFKFIGRALRADPGVRVTGLSRTSKQSVFRQNVESAGELLEGFPERVEQMALYRVLVLSDLKPQDLSPAQQEIVARFCGELGGGVLLIGGASSFDASWQGSRLEELLPVTFDVHPGITGLDRPFHLRLTDEALRSPIFQVKDDGGSRAVWEGLPTFTQYGRVLAAKPAATVWATHDQEVGPQGRRILMASQPYGAGLTAVVTVPNLWRWRLAKGADPRQFDRFWQQLFRFLGQSGRQDIAIQLPDQELAPGAELRALLERQPRPEAGKPEAQARYTVRVLGPDQKPVVEREVELLPLRPVPVVFRAEREGTYAVVVRAPGGAQVAGRTIPVREFDRELQRTGRDMENLRQWARMSGGSAMAAEDCRSEGLVSELKARVAQVRTGRHRRRPLGLDGRVMSAVLLCLGGEWLLRRRWGLA
jgi:hypothetical protein